MLFSCGGSSSELAVLTDSISTEETPKSNDLGNLIWENLDAVTDSGMLETEFPVGNLLGNLRITLDTLEMDSRDALVNLQYELSRLSLSPDKRKLYTLHPSLGILSIFDLNEKRLIEQVQFEKEGPNGIPPLVWYFLLVDENRFLMSDYKKIGIYDSKASITETILLDPKNFKELSPWEETSLFENLAIDANHRKLYSLPKDPDLEKVSLAILDWSTGKTQLVPLPEFGFLTRFHLVFKEGIQSSEANTAKLKLKIEKDQVLIYSQGTGSFYVYDIQTEKLRFITPQHELVANQQEPPDRRTFTTLAQLEETYFKLLSQVSYWDLVYDDKRKVYFRFAGIPKPGFDFGTWATGDVFLFAYDQDFKLIGEKQLGQLSKVPEYPFFKDGKLWSYVNVEDELGFSVMDFEF